MESSLLHVGVETSNSELGTSRSPCASNVINLAHRFEPRDSLKRLRVSCPRIDAYKNLIFYLTIFTDVTMTASKQTVLVFGPTGAVGCAAAIEAHRRGAHVWLAMRDTSKKIDGLSESDLESERFSRVQADLDKPDTLKRAKIGR